MTIAAISTDDLLPSFPKLFQSDLGRITTGKHRIKLQQEAKPFAISQPRPVPLAKRQAVCDAIDRLVRDDLIEPIQCSEWVHPLVAVWKKDGTIRICTDLRMLNRYVIIEKFPLPTADELLVKLSGARIFTKLDIRDAYFHMPLTDDSKPLTAFLTPKGLYQFKVLPMGLNSAPASWQKFISISLADLPGCIAYMDDICVFGSSVSEHKMNLLKVLNRLNGLNLRLNRQKCQFGVPEITFLGHVICAAGVRPSQENIRAIIDCPRPQNCEEVKHFLGMCSYYLKHLANFATVAEPLRCLSRKGEDFRWSDDQENAYNNIRTMVSSAPTMAIFDENCATFVSTDASDVGLGAVLSQLQNGRERVIAYASRTLSKTERNYSAGEKEALACLWACERWHLYLFGRRFTLRTDHAALTTLLCRGSKGQKPLRIGRWYSRLLSYDFEVKYIPGLENRVPDALSRLPLENRGENEDLSEIRLIASLDNQHLSAITHSAIQKSTEEDSTLQLLSRFIQNDWPQKKDLPSAVTPYYPIRHELSVVDHCILRGGRIVVPGNLIQSIIACAHEGHPGIVRTKSRIREYYWWPRMNATVEAAVRQCAFCQHADKSVTPISPPTQPIEYPMRPWAKVALDIMGPFMQAPPNKRNMLVATCFYTKWPEALMCGDITSQTVIKWLRDIFARFGLPEDILTDNGPQFRSKEFEEFLNTNGIVHSTTVPYNPAANGMVERMNRTLKEAVQTIQLQGERWEDALVTALAAYRTTPHTATGKTPSELMFSRKIRTKLNAAVSTNQKPNPQEIAKRESYQNTYRKEGKTLTANSMVRVRKENTRKGENVFTEPIRVTRVCGPGTYQLENGNKVNARRLCKASGNQRTTLPPNNNSSESTTVGRYTQVRRSSRISKPVERFI